MAPILCPHCRRLISSDEPRCPHCGLHAPGMRFRRAFLGWLRPGPRELVRTLVTVNVVWFGLSLLVDPGGLRGGGNPLAFLSPSERGLLFLGATGALPVVRLGRWWTLLAANFLHGGLLHLFFNMAALAQVGPFVAREYGTARFLVIYL
ncbi:MAG: rhomboid family intramembrane serine protease, partial [Candidatus Dadabacteria bacterium]